MTNTSNVKPSALNYDHYSMSQYDRDIEHVIPFHRELHREIQTCVKERFSSDSHGAVVDIGAGTGLTSAVVREVLPCATFDLIDFSKQMLDGAKKKLGSVGVRYFLKDFSELSDENAYDLATAVIGIHHQSAEGKRRLFRKIFACLKPGGVFLFGDLMTYREEKQTALAHAQHYAHLVEHATDQKTLIEWAHHHLFLNDLAHMEDQIQWLEEVGFEVTVRLREFQTVLLMAEKPRK